MFTEPKRVPLRRDEISKKGPDNILILLIGGIPIAVLTILSVILGDAVQQLAKHKAIVTRITAHGCHDSADDLTYISFRGRHPPRCLRPHMKDDIDASAGPDPAEYTSITTPRASPTSPVTPAAAAFYIALELDAPDLVPAPAFPPTRLTAIAQSRSRSTAR
ncbi:hypothetical protein K438DRAFT_2018108 [Mycena galopus ATCC 62051]|nr:hypothetical protein K438DRAFT_2018108 [Mycena galopus ATCC 62051]